MSENQLPELRVSCPDCETLSSFALNTPLQEQVSWHCHSCKSEKPLKFSEEIRSSGKLDRCPLCDGNEFYAQKDFNRRIGMTLIVLGASAMFIMIAMDYPSYWAYLPLGLAALVDRILYYFLPNVQVCYACDTVFKNFGETPTPEEQEFNLATHDAYKYWDKGKKKVPLLEDRGNS